MKVPYYLILILSSFASASGAAQAATVFSDLGSGSNVYDANNGFGITGSTSGQPGPFTWGWAFTPSDSALLTQIDIAIQNVSGTNSARVTLRADSTNSPGAILDTWDQTNFPAWHTCCTLQTLAPHLPVTLLSSSQYWMVVAPIASDTYDVAGFNTTGATGPRAISSNGGSSFGATTNNATIAAFDVIGTVVPEPGALLLVVAGIPACLGRRRWRR